MAEKDNGKKSDGITSETPAKAVEGPIKISREDYLECENYHLKTMVAAQKVALAKAALDQAEKALEVEQKMMIHIRQKVESKYSINFATHEIDGNTMQVKPRAQQIQQVMQSLQQSQPPKVV